MDSNLMIFMVGILPTVITILMIINIMAPMLPGQSGFYGITYIHYCNNFLYILVIYSF